MSSRFCPEHGDLKFTDVVVAAMIATFILPWVVYVITLVYFYFSAKNDQIAMQEEEKKLDAQSPKTAKTNTERKRRLTEVRRRNVVAA